MPAETWHFDSQRPGFSSLDEFLADVSGRAGMAERLVVARKRIAARAAPAPASLAQLRLKAGLSQKQLADAIGTSQPAISNYESGEREPTIANIKSMARALNVSFDVLLPVLGHNG
ncbi:helix-turn-helix domain-containing protein [Sphingobium sp. Ant17]|uniref:helix-turn-helix domain-containing protein n=1 Tax=Sphingobium sp. Ant17 TaxID=1461752 RepID=UPI001F4081F1|nr:helix-turn-helix transcriptional regulator [Sphingobium sp. Ant17]